MKKQISVHLFYLLAIAGILFWQNRERQKLLSQIEVEFPQRLNDAVRLLDFGRRANSREALAVLNAYRTKNNRLILPKIDLLANYSADCRELAEAEIKGAGSDWPVFLKKVENLADSTMQIAGNDPDFSKMATFKKLTGTEFLFKNKAAKSLILLALQTDIFFANSVILRKVGGDIEVRFDHLEPFVDLKKGNPKVGEICTASIFLMPSPTADFTQKKVEIEVNGHKIPQINGLGLYETQFTKGGKTSIKVQIKTIDPITGESRSYWKEQVIDVLP